MSKLLAQLNKWRLALSWEYAMLLWRVRQKLPGAKTVTYTPAKIFTGSASAPVAICTLNNEALIEQLSSMPGIHEKVAMIGRVQTENIGIEKMVQNLVGSPVIRFLIVCSEESKHMVGQAITSLALHGMDQDKRIIGAKGPIPYLFNATHEQVEAFREQVEVINLVGQEDPHRIVAVVDECLLRNPGRYSTERDLASEPVEEITASHDDAAEWKFDPAGFFLVSLDRQKKELIVEHYTRQGRKRDKVITGKSAEELTHTITRLNLVTYLDHAAYIGRELAKAEAALHFNLDYEQDKPLRQAEAFALR